MVAKTYSATQAGVDGELVTIEAILQGDTPLIQLTGLPNEVVKQSRERVTAAYYHLGLDIPSRRVVVHLSPANARKEGSQFDLGIALTVLAVEGRIPADPLSRMGFLGELGLDGKVHGVKNALSLAEALDRNSRIDHILVSEENEAEVGLLQSPKTWRVHSLAEAMEFIEKKGPLEKINPVEGKPEARTESLDKVIGQAIAKRALQIALAGKHHLLLLGPPGVGKTLLASTAADLLPSMSQTECVELAKIQGSHRSWMRPFRSPHPSVSTAAILGGGTGVIIPGEVSLAHAGILFLDEFPEFKRDVIEGLRDPLQSGVIHIHRVGVFHKVPAGFQLIAAMNPCPCGNALSTTRKCYCPWEKVAAYRKRISGAILDRIEMGLVIPQAAGRAEIPPHLKHRFIKESIARVRKGKRNLPLSSDAAHWIAEREKDSSFRGMKNIVGVARTIADLAESEAIQLPHLQEAWTLRCPDLHSLPR